MRDDQEKGMPYKQDVRDSARITERIRYPDWWVIHQDVGSFLMQAAFRAGLIVQNIVSFDIASYWPMLKTMCRDR